jgi:hypothetical protein
MIAPATTVVIAAMASRSGQSREEHTHMGRTFTKSKSDFSLPDDFFGDVYTFRFDHIVDQREFDNRENPAGPKDVSLNIQFVVDEEPDRGWNGTEVRAFYPEKVTDGNKTGKLFAAMFGGQLPDEFTEDMLSGRRFRATANKNDRGYPELTSPIAVRSSRAAGTGTGATPSVPSTSSSLGVPGVDEPGF